MLGVVLQVGVKRGSLGGAARGGGEAGGGGGHELLLRSPLGGANALALVQHEAHAHLARLHGNRQGGPDRRCTHPDATVGAQPSA